MNKKLLTAAAAIMAATVFSSCSSGNTEDIPIDASEYTNESVSSITETSPVTSSALSDDTAPAVDMPVAEEEKPEPKVYTKEIMFVGDDMCAGFAGCADVDDGMVFAAEGLAADDIEGKSFSVTGGEYTAAEWAAENKPAYIYVWLGINDLSYCNDYAYYMSMKSVIKSLNEASPDSIIAVMELSPVGRSSSWDSEVCGGGAKYDISVYRDTLVQLVSDLGIENVVHFDISDALEDEDGRLLEQYDSGDGMHLNADGYLKLCAYITENRYVNEAMGDTIEESINVVTEPDDISVSEMETVSDSEEETETETEEESEEDENGDYKTKYPDLYSKRAAYTVTEGKVCYLTFDDGPSDLTPEILDILKENDIKATFFIVGWCIDGREDILKRAVEEGHTIGIHTYSHEYDEIYSSVNAYLSDFNKAYNAIYDTCGVKPWLFRFPGGSYNSFNTETAEDIITEMNRRGFVYFDWNCATSDATLGASYDSCIENFEDTFGADYETVLMHDSKDLTVEYLQDLIDHARSEGYTFETLDNAEPIIF